MVQHRADRTGEPTLRRSADLAVRRGDVVDPREPGVDAEPAQGVNQPLVAQAVGCLDADPLTKDRGAYSE